MLENKYPQYPGKDRYIEFLAWHKGNIYRELYRLGYDIEDAIRLFQTGPLADSWDRGGHFLTKYYADNAAILFAIELRDYYGINIKPRDLTNPPFLQRNVADTVLEWIGRIYEIWARYSGRTSKEVYALLQFQDLCPLYSMGKYDDDYNFAVRINCDPSAYKLQLPDS